MTDPVHLSDDAKVALPLRNLVTILGVVAVSTWAYSGIMGRLNVIETQQKLDSQEIHSNTEFRIKWPRGEMGALPADARQDMLIEALEREVAAMLEDIEENEEWIDEFQPPPAVQDTVRRVRDLEIQIANIKAQLNN